MMGNPTENAPLGLRGKKVAEPWGPRPPICSVWEKDLDVGTPYRQALQEGKAFATRSRRRAARNSTDIRRMRTAQGGRETPLASLGAKIAPLENPEWSLCLGVFPSAQQQGDHEDPYGDRQGDPHHHSLQEPGARTHLVGSRWAARLGRDRLATARQEPLMGGAGALRPAPGFGKGHGGAVAHVASPPWVMEGRWSALETRLGGSWAGSAWAQWAQAKGME